MIYLYTTLGKKVNNFIKSKIKWPKYKNNHIINANSLDS